MPGFCIAAADGQAIKRPLLGWQPDIAAPLGYLLCGAISGDGTRVCSMFQLDLDWCTFSRKALRQRVRALQGWVEQPPGCARQPATPPHCSRQQQQLQGTALEGLRLMPWLAPAQ